MKIFYATLLMFILSFSLHGQSFEWAKSIDRTGAKEVIGLAVNDSGEVFLAGVYTGPLNVDVPFIGNAYIIKTDAEGNQIWEQSLGEEVNIIDLKCSGDDVYVLGMSYADNLELNQNPLHDDSVDVHLFVVRFNSEGSVVWMKNFPNVYTELGNMDIEDNLIAFTYYRQNIGGSLVFMDTDGNVLEEQDYDFWLDDVSIFDGNTYVVGVMDTTGVVIDDVVISIDGFFGLTEAFVVAFDESFQASWGVPGEAGTHSDSDIEVNEAGIFYHQFVFNFDMFPLSHKLEKLDFNGNSCAVEYFGNNNDYSHAELYLTDCQIGLFGRTLSTDAELSLLNFNHDLENLNQIDFIDNAYMHIFSQVAVYQDIIYISNTYDYNVTQDGVSVLENEIDDAVKRPYVVKFSAVDGCAFSGGCTDSAACNYDCGAGNDDGSCEYASCIDCPGDFNGDLTISIRDLALLLSDFGCNSSCTADLNSDAAVTSMDVSLFLNMFGSSCE